MLTEYFDTYARNYRPYKGGAWCYEDGCLYRGLELLHRATGESHWLAHLERLVEAQITPEGGLLDYNPSEYNIDHIRSGGALLYLHAQTGKARYLQATAPLLRQLETHPRTDSGVFWHKLNYPWQIWLDGLYMAVPFRIGHAIAVGRPEVIDDALTQLSTALKSTHDATSGLYAHAYDEARMQKWADPVSGQSFALWSRAIGWLCMCLVDVADLVGPQRFKPFQQKTADLLGKILALRSRDGLWMQVIDRPDLDGNYQEASASAMFVYALQSAARQGIFTSPNGDLLNVLTRNTLRHRVDGQMEMYDICGVAGLGAIGGVYRDGSPAYYLSEARVADDPKGVGPLMMCMAEALLASRATAELADS